VKKQRIGLSVIIPVYNAHQWIIPTIEHIRTSLLNSEFDAEIIVVDDGSSDGSADAAETVKLPEGIPLRVLRQKNKGRYLARKAGVLKAKKDNILFIDSRVFIGEQSLAYLFGKLKDNPDQIWNGHVEIEKKQGGVFARFWDAVACIGWRKYFRKPHETSYGIEEFDHYPKGTGFFYVPKKRLKEAMNFFEKTTNDIENSSDDTLLIRYLAERQNIHLSPEFSCLYHGRSNLPSFLKHAYFRGQFFIDGFLRPGTRFFWPLIVVLAGSAVTLVALAVFTNITLIIALIGMIVFALGLFFGALFFGVRWRDAASLAVLGVPFAFVYLAGLWRGVVRKSRLLNALAESMEKRRNFLNGSVLEYLAVALIFFFITYHIMGGVLSLSNISYQFFTQGPGDATAGFAWLNFANPGLDLLVDGDTNKANYPHGENTGGLFFLTYLLLWMPVRLASFIFGPVAGVNIITALGFISTALAAYWLMKRLTSSVGVALFAGYALSFYPYAVAKGSAHMAYIFNGFFVLLLAVFIKLWLRPTKKAAILFGFTIAACFYFDGYFLLLAPVMTIALVLGGMLYLAVTKVERQQWMYRIKMLVISFFTTLLLAVPILTVGVFFSDKVEQSLASTRSDIAIEIPFYRAWPIDFMIPAKDNPYFNSSDKFLALHEHKSVRSDSLSSTLYVGWINVILAIIGCGVLLFSIVSYRKELHEDSKPKLGLATYSKTNIYTQKFILIGLIFLVSSSIFLSFMLSPSISIFGITIPLPGKLLIDLDIGLWRNLSRFSGPLQVVLVVFASYSLWVLLKWLRPTEASSTIKRTIISGVMLAPLILIILMSFGYKNTINLPPYDLRKQGSGYNWLEGQDDSKVVAYMPIVDPLDEVNSTYSTMQIYHNKKMINIKNPESRVNANVLGSIENEESIDWAYLRGADFVVVHFRKSCPNVEWGLLMIQDGWRKTCIYRFNDQRKADNYFVRFEKGVDPTPNFAEGSKNALRPNSDKVTMRIVDEEFNPIKKKRSKAYLELDIDNWKQQDAVEGAWSVVQDGKQIKSGYVGKGLSKVSVEVDPIKAVTIVLDRENKGNDLLIRNTSVRQIH
jgi:glycosyltransferase involved in cell wall biosynthesis